MSKYKTTHLSPSEIDHLRFKAFATNGQEDMAAYYRAASLYFQERDVRAMNRADRIEELKAKLAEAERVARYETDIAEQALDQMKAEKARAESAEARIAHLENHIEGVAKDTHKIMVAYATAHADVLGVAKSLEDAYWSREVTPTPTAAELMARIQTGENE